MACDEKIVDNVTFTEVTATLAVTEVTATIVDIYEVVDVILDHEGNPILDHLTCPINDE